MAAKSLFAKALLIGTALALTGCASQNPESRVTRFHLGQPIAPGELAVEPRDPTLSKDLEFQAYARIVQAEFSRLGFGAAPDLTRSELVAVTEVSRSYRPTGQSSGSISFPIGKQREKMDVLTRLSVQLKRRSDSTVIWEGRAESVARDGSPNAHPEAAVARLAQAMFQGFPGRSGEIITVK